MGAELISIREAARRLGISDTAVRKAIAGGRLPTEDDGGKQRLRWPEAKLAFHERTDISKRSHVGSRGGETRKDLYRHAEDSPPTNTQYFESGGEDFEAMVDELRSESRGSPSRPRSGKRPRLDVATPVAEDEPENLAAAKAVLENYKAKLAKLRYERESELLVEVAEVQAATFRVHRQIREALQNLPDRIASQLAHMSDEADVYQFLAQQLQEVMQNLAEDVYVSV